MTAESVLEAIKIAQKRKKINIRKPVIIHSDRGIQFTGELYKEITEKMKRSYSKKHVHGTECTRALVPSIRKKGVVKSV